MVRRAWLVTALRPRSGRVNPSGAGVRRACLPRPRAGRVASAIWSKTWRHRSPSKASARTKWATIERRRTATCASSRSRRRRRSERVPNTTPALLHSYAGLDTPAQVLEDFRLANPGHELERKPRSKSRSSSARRGSCRRPQRNTSVSQPTRTTRRCRQRRCCSQASCTNSRTPPIARWRSTRAMWSSSRSP